MPEDIDHSDHLKDIHGAVDLNSIEQKDQHLLIGRLRDAYALIEASVHLACEKSVVGLRGHVEDFVRARLGDTRCVLALWNGEARSFEVVEAEPRAQEAAPSLMGVDRALWSRVHRRLPFKVRESGVPLFCGALEPVGCGGFRCALWVPIWMGHTLYGLMMVESVAGGERVESALGELSVLAVHVAQALERIRYREMAITDGLTGVFVRRHFMQRLTEEMRRAARYRHPVSVAMLDLDHFKSHNDTYGHAFGDKVLTSVVSVIRGSVRQGIDLVGRLGGDEFGVIMPETDAGGAEVVIRRVLERVRRVRLGDAKVPMTVSIGAATCPRDAKTAAELMEQADRALYMVKAQGRDGAVVLGARRGAVLVKQSESESMPSRWTLRAL